MKMTAYRLVAGHTHSLVDNKGSVHNLICFKHIVDAYAYMQGWFGDTCTLYEVTGEVIEEKMENVQIEFRDKEESNLPRDIRVNVPCVVLRMENYIILGVFEYERTNPEDADPGVPVFEITYKEF